MSAMDVVDFHNHFVGPAFALGTLEGVPDGQRDFWEGVNRSLAAPDLLLGSLEPAGVRARVLSTPLEFLKEARGGAGSRLVERINDAMGELVARHPGRLHGLATVDAYGGAPAAQELRRAVRLGLRGVFMESAKGPLLPDAPEALPTLATAAELGVPVFLHPVADPDLDARFRKFGRMGLRLTRSTINAAALYALLEAGLFERFSGLRVVVTALALGGVLLAAGSPDGARLRRDTPPAKRRHVYIDTTGMDPVGLRAAIDVVGADHVVTGTDWPVVREEGVPARLRAMLQGMGLDQAACEAIAGGNALRLLGVS
jgi:aminocarboxymuconate-semialdehyde decarboxylase